MNAPHPFFPAICLFLLISIFLLQGCGKKEADKDITMQKTEELNKEKIKENIYDQSISLLLETKATKLLDSLIKSGKGYDTLIKEDDDITLILKNDKYLTLQELLRNNLKPQAAGYSENMTETYLEIAKEFKKAWEKLLIYRIIELKIVEVIKKKTRVSKVNINSPIKRYLGKRFDRYADDFNLIFEEFNFENKLSMDKYEVASTVKDLIEIIEKEVIKKVF